METFSALLAICAGNSPVSGEFPAQRPVTRNFDVFFDLRWINRRVNNGEAGDLRRYRAHYDVIVMKSSIQALMMTFLFQCIEMIGVHPSVRPWFSITIHLKLGLCIC